MGLIGLVWVRLILKTGISSEGNSKMEDQVVLALWSMPTVLLALTVQNTRRQTMRVSGELASVRAKALWLGLKALSSLAFGRTTCESMEKWNCKTEITTGDNSWMICLMARGCWFSLQETFLRASSLMGLALVWEDCCILTAIFTSDSIVTLWKKDKGRWFTSTAHRIRAATTKTENTDTAVCLTP